MLFRFTCKNKCFKLTFIAHQHKYRACTGSRQSDNCRQSLTISADYTFIIIWTLYWGKNATKQLTDQAYTLCTLMDGNMFWNMVAISLTCMPSTPKLFSTSRGWCVNCCSCILCFFRDDTTSLTRAYWSDTLILEHPSNSPLTQTTVDQSLNKA